MTTQKRLGYPQCIQREHDGLDNSGGLGNKREETKPRAGNWIAHDQETVKTKKGNKLSISRSYYSTLSKSEMISSPADRPPQSPLQRSEMEDWNWNWNNTVAPKSPWFVRVSFFVLFISSLENGTSCNDQSTGLYVVPGFFFVLPYLMFRSAGTYSIGRRFGKWNFETNGRNYPKIQI